CRRRVARLCAVPIEDVSAGLGDHRLPFPVGPANLHKATGGKRPSGDPQILAIRTAEVVACADELERRSLLVVQRLGSHLRQLLDSRRWANSMLSGHRRSELLSACVSLRYLRKDGVGPPP